jgi:hypothetical protein
VSPRCDKAANLQSRPCEPVEDPTCLKDEALAEEQTPIRPSPVRRTALGNVFAGPRAALLVHAQAGPLPSSSATPNELPLHRRSGMGSTRLTETRLRQNTPLRQCSAGGLEGPFLPLASAASAQLCRYFEKLSRTRQSIPIGPVEHSRTVLAATHSTYAHVLPAARVADFRVSAQKPRNRQPGGIGTTTRASP